MEQLEPITEERLLIYQNEQEVARITNEAQMRINLLNRILSFGVIANEDISQVTASAATIDDFIFQEQLKVNQELKKQFDAGKKNLKDEYALPGDLQSLKYSLQVWFNYSDNRNKFQFLTFVNDHWAIDEEKIESHFELQNNKVFVSGHKLEKYRKVQQLIELCKALQIPWNHLNGSSSFSNMIHATGRDITPRWQYFLDRS